MGEKKRRHNGRRRRGEMMEKVVVLLKGLDIIVKTVVFWVCVYVGAHFAIKFW